MVGWFQVQCALESISFLLVYHTEILLLGPCRNLQTIAHFIPLNKLPSLSSRYKPRLLLEQSAHVLQRKLRSLGQHKPEENSVCEVTDAEEDIVAPATDVLNGNVSYLADHSVECKRGHGSDRNTLGTRLGVENFGADDPGERSDGRAEGKVVTPGHDDEGPASGIVVGGSRGELGNQNCRNYLGKSVAVRDRLG